MSFFFDLQLENAGADIALGEKKKKKAQEKFTELFPFALCLFSCL